MNDARDIFQSRGEDTSDEPDVADSLESSPIQIRLDHAFFVDLGCAAWRLQQRMINPVSGEIIVECRQLARHVITICDRLSDIGLHIQDHTGKPYDSGQSLEVLAFQPTDGIASEVVLETVRPSLYLREHRILKGQVIVGTPKADQEGKK